MQLLFAYLDLLRAEGPQQWLYDEQSRLADLQFRFREQANPVNYVSALASGMHDYAPEDILRGGSLMSEYAPALIEELLAAVVPENAQGKPPPRGALQRADRERRAACTLDCAGGRYRIGLARPE